MTRRPSSRPAAGRADWRRRFQTAALGAVLSLARFLERDAGKPPPRRRLISCLRGLAPADLAERLRGAAPEFGIFSGLAAAWVEARVDLLLEEGYLEQVAPAAGAPPRVALAGPGRRVLGGSESIVLAEAPAAPAPAAGEPAGRLGRLRAALARERGRPAYGIFSNAVLAQIAARRPRHLGELAAIPGIGPARLRDFGRRILVVLNEKKGGITPDRSRPGGRDARPRREGRSARARRGRRR